MPAIRLFAHVVLCLFLAQLLAAPAGAAAAEEVDRDRPAGHPELVTTVTGPMPTGVTVSAGGRIFLNFPRWGDKVDFTVAELKDGKPVAFPDPTINQLDEKHPEKCLVSVQSVVVDPIDRLWILDTGSLKFGPTLPGGPKLVGVDLKTNAVVSTIPIPLSSAPRTSYLNDVRFDLRRGNGGLAFITDSTGSGPNGIVVVELGSGRSWRCLNDHPSTKAEKDFLPIVEGRPMLFRPGTEAPKFITIGSDGIAISPDGKTLYYSPLAARRLYSVSVDALADPQKAAEAGATVKDLGPKSASDGLESDAAGWVYAGDYEHNGILRMKDGVFETVVHDTRLLWPDTLCLAGDGYLYFTANQLHRQGLFHAGKDERRPPYGLFRVKVDAQPVRLK
jgi:sugar lactone lactonase YvrE